MRYVGVCALIVSALLMITSFAAEFGDLQIVLAALSMASVTLAIGLLMGASEHTSNPRRLQ